MVLYVMRHAVIGTSVSYYAYTSYAAVSTERGNFRRELRNTKMREVNFRMNHARCVCKICEGRVNGINGLYFGPLKTI